MEIYTADMFTNEGVEISITPLRTQLEIVEYTYNYLLKQIDDVKKNVFQELYVYETMKKTDKTLIPNITVLTQFKALERDPTYLDFKKELEIAKTEIKLLNIQIDREFAKISNTFTFTEYNLKRYLDLSILFFSSQSDYDMNQLMDAICTNELGMSKIFQDLRWSRSYDVYQLIIEKAPQDWQSLFADIIKVIAYLDVEFNYTFWNTHPEYEFNVTKIYTEYNKQHYLATEYREGN